MKTYRKVCAVISLAIIYMLVNINSEFELWERIVWLIGMVCYCIAFNSAPDEE